MDVHEMERETLETYKTKIEEIIEYVKINKRVTLPTISDKYTWLNMRMIQNHLRKKCLELGWHIEKLGCDGNYCVINIYAL